MGAAQALRLGLDIAGLDQDLGAQRLQSLDVLIDRARADRAAAGQGHIGFAEAGQQWPQQQDGAAHGLDQFIGGVHRMHLAGVDAQVGAVTLHGAAQQGQQFQRRVDIPHPGNIAYMQGLGAQQGGGDDRQGRIFCARYPHFTAQWAIAGDDDFFHQAGLGRLEQARLLEACIGADNRVDLLTAVGRADTVAQQEVGRGRGRRNHQVDVDPGLHQRLPAVDGAGAIHHFHCHHRAGGGAHRQAQRFETLVKPVGVVPDSLAALGLRADDAQGLAGGGDHRG